MQGRYENPGLSKEDTLFRNEWQSGGAVMRALASINAVYVGSG